MNVHNFTSLSKTIYYVSGPGNFLNLLILKIDNSPSLISRSETLFTRVIEANLDHKLKFIKMDWVLKLVIYATFCILSAIWFIKVGDRKTFMTLI
jgi:predicted outer membrane lipoprotein